MKLGRSERFKKLVRMALVRHLYAVFANGSKCEGCGRQLESPDIPCLCGF
jgi:hypothetical protein